MVMKNSIYIILCCLLTSCFERPPKRVNEFFNYENNKNDAQLCGLYKQTDSTGWSSYYVFYNDGTVVSGINESFFSFYKSIGGITGFMDTIKKDSLLMKFYLRRFNWGYYSINNDTLSINEIVGRSEGNAYWFTNKKTFLTIPGNCLQQIDRETIYPIDKNPKINEKYSKLIFIDTFDCRESNTWLKYQNWFWKNESDYQNWIKYKTGIDLLKDKKGLKKLKTP
jgi:hypothetical protein